MSERSKILYIDHVAQIGGAERGLIDLLRLLDRRLFDPVAVLPGAGPLSQEIERAGVPVHFLPLRRFKRTRNPLVRTADLLHAAVTAFRLARLIRRENIRLVHSNGNNAHIYGGLAARLARVPSVWHSRDLVPLGFAGRVLDRLADRIVAISDAVAGHLRRGGCSPEKIVMIHNGVNVPGFRQKASEGAGREVRTELGVGEDAFLVGMAAQMVPWKGHRLFMAAAARAAARMPHAVFAVIGADLFDDHPGYRQELESLVAASGLSGCVLFTGHRSDGPAMLATLDLLVHPAAQEPFGRVLIEAMCLGKPVIALDDAGPREIVENGVSGILVGAGDPNALAAAIQGVAADPAMASRMGKAAMRRVEERFDARGTAARVEALYAELLGANEDRH